MTKGRIVNATKSGEFNAAELAEVAGAAYAVWLRCAELGADELIEEADAATGFGLRKFWFDG